MAIRDTAFDLSEYPMQIKVRIFAAQLNAAAGIGLWCFTQEQDESENKIFSTCLYEKEFLNFLELSECMSYLKTYKDGIKKPVIMSDELGITWVAEHAYCNGEVSFLVIMGPVFLNSTSLKYIERELSKRIRSVQLQRQMTRTLASVPVLYATMLDQYAKMLHFMLTNERIRSVDFDFQNKAAHSESKGQSVWDESNKEVWDHASDRMLEVEQMILSAVREGNLQYREILEDSLVHNSDFVSSTGNPLRDGKNSVITQDVLCCRAAIEGGLSVNTAKGIEEHYMTEIEKASTQTELKNIFNSMVGDYVTKVRECRENPLISKSIRECCDYIRVNVQKPLTVEQIAGEMGYTTYYFTKKFNKEMGIKVTDYIKQVRIEYAKVALITTNRSIQDISDSLQFGSRNYFSKVFHSIVGVTPAAYREMAGRLPDGDMKEL